MSSSNYRRNKAAIDEFRKALKAEIDDLSEIDVKVLNKAVNEGLRWLKAVSYTHLPVLCLMAGHKNNTHLCVLTARSYRISCTAVHNRIPAPVFAVVMAAPVPSDPLEDSRYDHLPVVAISQRII